MCRSYLVVTPSRSFCGPLPCCRHTFVRPWSWDCLLWSTCRWPTSPALWSSTPASATTLWVVETRQPATVEGVGNQQEHWLLLLNMDKQANLEATACTKFNNICLWKKSRTNKNDVAPLDNQLLKLKAKLYPEATAPQEEHHKPKTNREISSNSRKIRNNRKQTIIPQV